MIKNNKKGVLVFDADGVLLFWLNGMIHFLREKGLPYSHLTNERNAFYSLQEIFLSEDDELITSLYEEFLSSPSVSKMGRFKEESLSILKELAEEYILVVLTCIGRKQHVVDFRKEEIHKLYPDCFSDIYCIELGESKQETLEFLSDVYDGQIKGFIDDRDVHVKEAVLAGISGYQYSEDAPKDKIDSSLNQLYSWKDIRNEFL